MLAFLLITSSNKLKNGYFAAYQALPNRPATHPANHSQISLVINA
jgi:hypothetical protein